MVVYEVPRFVGNPYQYYVETPDEFRDFVSSNSGKQHVYTSHNAMPAGARYVLLRYIPFDFDAKEEDGTTISDCLHDIRQLKDWADKNGQKLVRTFTGGRGYHGYLEFKPIKAINNVLLADYYKAVQMKVIEECNFTTVDLKIVGDTRRLMRVVNTMHPRTGLYCVELPQNFDWDQLQVETYASRPRPSLPSLNPSHTFLDYVKEVGLEPRRHGIHSQQAEVIDYSIQDDELGGMVKAVIPRMCIHNSLASDNPPHLVRFEACVQLVKSNFDSYFIKNFFRNIAEKYKWVNRKNIHNMDYHIDYLCRTGHDYKVHSCQTVRENGLCVGKTCPLFAHNFPEEANDD